tara:strand:- start:831 stop:1130 length:300 start_codon:yes stop_codon:yes gene_type:complete
MSYVVEINKLRDERYQLEMALYKGSLSQSDFDNKLTALDSREEQLIGAEASKESARLDREYEAKSRQGYNPHFTTRPQARRHQSGTTSRYQPRRGRPRR